MKLKIPMTNRMFLSFAIFLLFVICHFPFVITDAQASVAGQFYPADKKELLKTIDSLLKPYKVIRGEGELLAIIVPHAGYQYSGSVAAYAYRQLTNKDFDTVVVIGLSHYTAFDGISVIPSGEYTTPLGTVDIDEEFMRSLMNDSPKIFEYKRAWNKEHSVDVQVPFLQRTVRKFKIVPLIFGYQSLENCSILSEAILKASENKKVLIVSSTDLSHYHSSAEAQVKDSAAIEAIGNGNVNMLLERVGNGACEMCGYGPVITAMLVADKRGANSYEILKYADSGDSTGDKSSVVGYMSAAIYKRPMGLDEGNKTRLLEMARKTLKEYLSTGLKPEFMVYEKNLFQKTGVFVTLSKSGQLRGCIGYIKPIKPLYEAVQEMAIASATQDMRFTPVTSQELKELNIEISVISPMTKVATFEEIIVGRDGLYIVNGGRSGLLLPQVAIENNLTRDEFLQNVCYKAGMDPSLLNDKGTQLYKFQADIFHEE